MAGELNHIEQPLFIKGLLRGEDATEGMVWNLWELKEKRYWTLVQ
jgi:hypothetical protein